MIFPSHRKKGLIAQRIKVALPFKLFVFTAVWDCFVNLTPHDRGCEKRVSAAASRDEVYFLPTKKKKKNKGRIRCYLFYRPPGRAECSAAVMRCDVMQQKKRITGGNALLPCDCNKQVEISLLWSVQSKGRGKFINHKGKWKIDPFLWHALSISHFILSIFFFCFFCGSIQTWSHYTEKCFDRRMYWQLTGVSSSLFELKDIKLTPQCTVIDQMYDAITEPFWVK